MAQCGLSGCGLGPDTYKRPGESDWFNDQFSHLYDGVHTPSVTELVAVRITWEPPGVSAQWVLALTDSASENVTLHRSHPIISSGKIPQEIQTPAFSHPSSWRSADLQTPNEDEGDQMITPDHHVTGFEILIGVDCAGLYPENFHPLPLVSLFCFASPSS